VRPFDELSATGRARRLRPLAMRALAAWPLDVRALRLLSNDYNGVWRVDAAEGRFVLRVNLTHRSDAELRSELAWLEALTGVVRAPVPLRTRGGEPWAVSEALGVPGARRCVLFSWLPGRVMTPGDQPTAFADLGLEVAGLHMQARAWRRARGMPVFDRPFADPHAERILFDQALAPSVRSVFRDAECAAAEAYKRLIESPERPSIAHHDVHVGNALVSRGRVSLIDFDDCVLAYRPEDLGRSLFQNRMRGCDERRLRAFRSGYEAIAAWPDVGDVEAFVAAAAMELANDVYQDADPDYRAAAKEYATRWAGVARRALGRI